MRGLLRPAPTLTGTEGAELKDKNKPNVPHATTATQLRNLTW